LAKIAKTKQLTSPKGNTLKKRHLIPTGKYLEASKGRHTVQDQNNIADEFIKYYAEDNQNLFFTTFFASRMISFKMIFNWKRSNPYFAYIYELAEMIREERLSQLLITTSAPTGVIFLLKNLHGYRNDPLPEPDPNATEVIDFEFTIYETTEVN